MLAYADNFRLLALLSLVCIPLVLVLTPPRHGETRHMEVSE